MITLQLDNDFLGEAWLLKTAIKNEINAKRKEIRKYKEAILHDAGRAIYYQKQIDEITRLYLNPLIKLYYKKIKAINTK